MKGILVSAFAVLAMMTVSTTVDAKGSNESVGNPSSSRTPVFSAPQILAQTNEVRVANGQGNGYRYEIWTNSRNTYYRLKVWQVQNYPNGPQASLYKSIFDFMGEAHDAFGCQFEHKTLPSCAAWMPRRTY